MARQLGRTVGRRWPHAEGRTAGRVRIPMVREWRSRYQARISSFWRPLERNVLDQLAVTPGRYALALGTSNSTAEHHRTHRLENLLQTGDLDWFPCSTRVPLHDRQSSQTI